MLYGLNRFKTVHDRTEFGFYVILSIVLCRCKTDEKKKIMIFTDMATSVGDVKDVLQQCREGYKAQNIEVRTPCPALRKLYKMN